MRRVILPGSDLALWQSTSDQFEAVWETSTGRLLAIRDRRTGFSSGYSVSAAQAALLFAAIDAAD